MKEKDIKKIILESIRGQYKKYGVKQYYKDLAEKSLLIRY